ncbi:transposase [Streptosporangium canum]|uniref:transposase n=1 Tax=Streptosporangium canum TaxID=324952 RepID=UPI0037A01FC7
MQNTIAPRLAAITVRPFFGADHRPARDGPPTGGGGGCLGSPPWQTVYWHFVRWEDQGVTQRIVDVLRRRIRKGVGRQAEPSAAVMDSPSVKGADTVGADSRGSDANKKVNGRKRSVVTDTFGLLSAVMVRPASVQDRAGATPCCWGCT